MRLTTFGTRRIERLLERYDASWPQAVANGRRHDGLKPSLLTPEVLEVVRLRVAEPPPDGGLWSSRKADRGRVAWPFGFALTDPGGRLSRTRLFPEVTRIKASVASRGE